MSKHKIADNDELLEVSEELVLNNTKYCVFIFDLDPASDHVFYPEAYDISEEDFEKDLNLAEDYLDVY
ncbi:MAG: hypothetical protein QW321_01945 [Candidatus Aenigmatarchaeota archaeon]